MQCTGTVFLNLGLLRIDFEKLFIFCSEIHTSLVWRGVIFSSKSNIRTHRGINCRSHNEKCICFHYFSPGTTTVFLCSISTKGLLGLLDSFITTPFRLSLPTPSLFLKAFEMFQVNSHPSVNSCLIYKISIYGSYFKVHPLRFFDTEVLCC